MRSSYFKSDVEILLKDITGLVKPQDNLERELLIQSGTHYCEMIPVEYTASDEYMRLYEESLSNFAIEVAQSVEILSHEIIKRKGNDVVLISLARAGIPIGILLKRCIEKMYNKKIKHYAISIIRGKGIDKNAMQYILQRHMPQRLQFVDGWVGKGAIYKELQGEIKNFNGVSGSLAVLSDPANITKFCGTNNDFLIPSSCLNATVSGLISRTFYRRDIIGQKDFHGAVYYSEFEVNDKSYQFIDEIGKFIGTQTLNTSLKNSDTYYEDVKNIACEFNIKDINLIKPGIGETTRVLLRRIPWKILVHDTSDKKYLGHIFRLAQEKKVEILKYPLKSYRSCGLIKSLRADI